MASILKDLRGLEIYAQDSGQREAREDLMAACEAYMTKNLLGDKETLMTIKLAWDAFDWRWGPDEIGQLILPNGMRA
jgi:hypothetical protein